MWLLDSVLVLWQFLGTLLWGIKKQGQDKEISHDTMETRVRAREEWGDTP